MMQLPLSCLQFAGNLREQNTAIFCKIKTKIYNKLQKVQKSTKHARFFLLLFAQFCYFLYPLVSTLLIFAFSCRATKLIKQKHRHLQIPCNNVLKGNFYHIRCIAIKSYHTILFVATPSQIWYDMYTNSSLKQNKVLQFTNSRTIVPETRQLNE
jgi:hypothetical protein